METVTQFVFYTNSVQQKWCEGWTDLSGSGQGPEVAYVNVGSIIKGVMGERRYSSKHS